MPLYEAGLSEADIDLAFDRLRECRLIGETDDGALTIYDPLPKEMFYELMNAAHDHAQGTSFAQVQGRTHVQGHTYVQGDRDEQGEMQVQGRAWVAGYATPEGHNQIAGRAQTTGHARVADRAQAAGHTQASGHTQVAGRAQVTGHIQVSDRAQAAGHTQAADHASLQNHAQGQADTQADGEDVATPVRDTRAPARSPLTKRRKASNMLQLVDVAEGSTGSENPDMQAVVQIYHKRIGMIGPTQYEKLRFWVEEMGMEGAVVAVAIEETVRSAEVPRISYLEGILRNWYNDGIRTFAELQERKNASKVLSSSSDQEERDSHEGYANASAYQSVSADMVAKWKELYPDEYDS